MREPHTLERQERHFQGERMGGGGKEGGAEEREEGAEHLVEGIERLFAGHKPPLHALFDSGPPERLTVALFLGRAQLLPPPRRRPPARLLKVDEPRLSLFAYISQVDRGVLQPELQLAAAAAAAARNPDARRDSHGARARAGLGPVLGVLLVLLAKTSRLLP